MDFIILSWVAVILQSRVRIVAFYNLELGGRYIAEQGALWALYILQSRVRSGPYFAEQGTLWAL